MVKVLNCSGEIVWLVLRKKNTYRWSMAVSRLFLEFELVFWLHFTRDWRSIEDRDKTHDDFEYIRGVCCRHFIVPIRLHSRSLVETTYRSQISLEFVSKFEMIIWTCNQRRYVPVSSVHWLAIKIFFAVFWQQGLCRRFNRRQILVPYRAFCSGRYIEPASPQ